MKPITLQETDDSYKGEHSAPDEKSGAPLHNLKGVYPDDFYTHSHYYADGSNHDHESTNVMKNVKDRPNAPVKIYRAVPKIPTHQEKLDTIEKHKKHILKHGKLPGGVVTNLSSSEYYDKIDDDQKELEKNKPEKEAPKIAINKGDWVTASHTYAKDHGEGALRGKYRILSKTVKASELFTDGNSIHEYGYHPKPKTLSESIEFAYLNMIDG